MTPAVTVPPFVYWQASAVPLLVQVMVAPGARVVPGQLTAPALSSFTVWFDSVTFPVLVTTYVHVTVDPTATSGPVPVSLSVPFVFFTSVMRGVPTASPKLL